MNRTLPGQVRALTVDVYCAAVRKWNSGYLKSNNSKRDQRFLLTCPDRVVLVDLPGYGKMLDRLLATGHEDEFSFSLPLDGCTMPLPPRFLEGLVEGVHRHEPLAVMALRQVLHLLAKLEWDDYDQEAAFQSFIERNASLPREIDNFPALTAASAIWHLVLGQLDWHDIIPRHGPGVVATHEKPWEKMGFKRIYATVQGYYPADAYFFLNATHLCDRLGDLLNMEEVPYPVTRLCAVPKDFRGPRLISAEPLETQWLQQGQARAMMEKIERHPLTKGYVNFTSQEVNRQLALSSSVSGDYTTLDLKDASDRVSVTLCRKIFDWESWKALSATRSVETNIGPLGINVPLNMFSPMGSAVCFPIESLVFYSLVLGAIHRHVYPRQYVTYKSLRPLLGSVYVYGDDIVVRSQFTDLAISTLTQAGLTVNLTKCCTGPRFRESCGLDAYCGQVVTPVRLKHLPCRQSPVTLASSCDYINRFNELGMQTVAASLEKWVTSEFGVLPRSYYDVPLTVRTLSPIQAALWNQEHFRCRRNPSLQCLEYLVPTLTYSYKRSTLPNWCEAFRSILLNTHACERGYTVPHRVRLTTRWA